jgi:hypothetical protein
MDLTAALAELASRGADHVSSARRTTFLNDAKNEFESVWPWPWLETTATGAAPLTVSDLRAVLYVVDSTNRRVLRGASAQDIVLQVDPTITTTGTPECWWLDGTTTLKVYPANTSVSLSVRYIKYSAELSAGADTPLIPTRLHNLWIDLAVIRVYQDSDELQAATALRADVRGRLERLVAEYEVRNRQNAPLQHVSLDGGIDW